MWQIRVRRVSNGFILDWEDDDGEEGRVVEEAIESKIYGDDNAEKEALCRALNGVVNYFGMGYQKHHQEDAKFVKIHLVTEDELWAEDQGLPGEQVHLYPVLSAEEAEKQARNP